MNRFLVAMISIIALVSVAKLTTAQSTEQPNSSNRVNSETVLQNSSYEVGTITGIVSGPNGSVLFVELSNKTKLRFHHPSTSLTRGEQVLVYEKDGDHFLVEASNPRR
ncbi:MAG: hypothetical protein QNJ64_11770 [Crocosphaera sp.]|nr:hypothetical protein [Crocosphaera sp.]